MTKGKEQLLSLILLFCQMFDTIHIIIIVIRDNGQWIIPEKYLFLGHPAYKIRTDYHKFSGIALEVDVINEDIVA